MALVKYSLGDQYESILKWDPQSKIWNIEYTFEEAIGSRNLKGSAVALTKDILFWCLNGK